MDGKNHEINVWLQPCAGQHCHLVSSELYCLITEADEYKELA